MLAFLREYDHADGTDIVLCVNNLSRFPQPVELDLRRFNGYRPTELTGGVVFPSIGELPYLLTAPGHGFYWFSLTPDPDSPAGPVGVSCVLVVPSPSAVLVGTSAHAVAPLPVTSTPTPSATASAPTRPM